MKNTTILITLILTFIIFCNKVNAAPPMYVNDPDCTVSGIVKNTKLEEGSRGWQYQKCLNAIPDITDCEWILAAGKDKYLTTLQVSESINKQSVDDNVICGNLYPSGKEHIFSISVNLFKQFQIKNGDIISGNVMRGGEFSSLQKEGLNSSISQKLYYFILKNLFWFIALIPIIFIIILIIIKKSKSSPK